MPNAPTILPAPADASTDTGRNAVSTYVNGLVMESWTRQGEYNVWARSELNLNLFLYSRCAGRQIGIYRAPKIQNACISNAAIQAAERPDCEIKRRTTGEPPVYYFSPDHAPPELLQMMPPDAQQPTVDAQGNVVPPRALTQQEANVLQQAIMIAKQKSLMTGLPPEVPPDCLVTLDDSSIPEALETVLDFKFDEAEGGDMFFENTLYNNVFGQQDMVVHFDDDTKSFKFKNPEVACVHVDITKTDISQAAYVVYDEFLGRYEALELYPEMADAINRWAQGGAPTIAGQVPYRLPYYWTQRYFYREVIIIRTCWLRNQPYPMSPDEAMAKGHVAIAEVQDGDDQDGTGSGGANTETSTDGASARSVSGGIAGGISAAPDGTDFGGADTNNPLPTGPTDGQPGASVQADSAGPGAGQPLDATEDQVDPDADAGESPATPPLPKRSAFFPAINGQPQQHLGEIHPQHPNWPVRRALREIRIVAGQVYYDRESQRTDIPIARNINIPIPFTPWGQGEPERLERLSEAHSNILSDTVIHKEYMAYPTKIIPQSVMKENPKLVNGYALPKTMLTVQDATWMKFQGKVMQSLDVTPIGSDNFQMLEMLDNLIDDSSNQSDALRGELPSSNTSGVTLGRLQSAGATSIKFKAKRAERMLKQVFKVMIGDIIMRITAEELAQDFPEYDLHVWYEIKNRWMKHYLYPNLTVSVSSGRGQMETDRANALIAAAQRPVPISDETLQEALGLDPGEEADKAVQSEKRNAQTQQIIQGMAAQFPPQNPAGQPPMPPQPQPPQAPAPAPQR